MEVYADYAATTPVDRDILKNIIDNADEFGNPSSIHKAGKRAKAQLEKARRQTAALLNASASEIIFTSGATEANNMAIRGVIGRRDRPHVITTEVEHASVLNTFRALEADAEVTYVPADERGVVDMGALKRALRQDTALVSIMLVNNETGVMQPIYEIREMLSGSDALLHVDAVQAFGHMTVDVEDLGVDLLSLSAHKLYGPKGVGLLYKSKDVHLDPVITGGSQERDARGGTENTMWIQAMAAAMHRPMTQQPMMAVTPNTSDL